jgi:hypothetical protein
MTTISRKSFPPALEAVRADAAIKLIAVSIASFMVLPLLEKAFDK